MYLGPVEDTHKNYGNNHHNLNKSTNMGPSIRCLGNFWFNTQGFGFDSHSELQVQNTKLRNHSSTFFHEHHESLIEVERIDSKFLF